MALECVRSLWINKPWLFCFACFQNWEVVADGGRSSAEAKLLQDGTLTHVMVKRLPGSSSTASTI